MKELTENIIYLLREQDFVIVSTLDSEGKIHCAAKGLVEIEKEGKVYLMDLYLARTFNNLKKNTSITITAVDEHKFLGYVLKGEARMIQREEIKSHMIENWEKRVMQRISKRMSRSIKEGKKDSRHPEIYLPQPEYLIEMQVDEVVDLAPAHLKKLENEWSSLEKKAK